MKKFLITTILALFSVPALAFEGPINEEVAVLIARAYVVGVQYPVDGNLEEELFEASLETELDYKFVVLDASGDCALEVVVTKMGAIDPVQTKASCN